MAHITKVQQLSVVAGVVKFQIWFSSVRTGVADVHRPGHLPFGAHEPLDGRAPSVRAPVSKGLSCHSDSKLYCYGITATALNRLPVDATNSVTGTVPSAVLALPTIYSTPGLSA